MDIQTPQRFWFRRKWYGWGWFPSAWQGWLVLAVYAIVLTLLIAHVHMVSGHRDSSVAIIASVVTLTVVLVIVCYWKGEKPKWQWGRRDE